MIRHGVMLWAITLGCRAADPTPAREVAQPTPAKAAPAPAGKTTHIAISAMQFVPANAPLAAGDKVVWKNEDLVPHSVTAEDASFDSGIIAAGASWEHTINKSVSYHCAFHPTMKGALTVQ